MEISRHQQYGDMVNLLREENKMNDNLLKALLSMDAYNRGYDAGIGFINKF